VTRQTAHQDTKHVKDKVDVTATIIITIAAVVVLPQIKGTVNAETNVAASGSHTSDCSASDC